MRLITVRDYNILSELASKYIRDQLKAKPDSVLGLATGSTPLGMYQRLIKLYKEGILDFSKVTTFNLDEYIGIDGADKNSYHFYMLENFINHINIDKNNFHIPKGNAKDIKKECRRYEDLIKDKGPIDLQILGIGANGHIGFNEPNDYFENGVHSVHLKEKTIESNARFFSNKEAVPREAISMGVKSIMEAKTVILLVAGEEKAEALYKTINGPITPQVPASILQRHTNAIVIADEKAMKKRTATACT